MNGNILFVHGDTGRFLAPAQGQASLNIIDMARDGLQMDLRTSIQNAVAGKTPVVSKDLMVMSDDAAYRFDLAVRPVTDPKTTRDLLFISFQDAELAPIEKSKPKSRTSRKGASQRVEELEQELAYTRENLHATIEEMQAANEELKSTNEELQSTNEELQSTNEELETSKEELQSVNEEIVTVNAELQSKIEQLTEIQNDMKNLLENVNTGTIFLDTHLHIKRFTHGAARCSGSCHRIRGDRSRISGQPSMAKISWQRQKPCSLHSSRVKNKSLPMPVNGTLSASCPTARSIT